MPKINSKHWKPGEIVIELAGKHSQNFQIKSLGARLRGRFDVRHIRASSSKTRYAELPTIPGIVIALDSKNRTVRTVDPLGLPEFENVLETINEIVEPWQGPKKPWATTEQERLDDTQIKTILWEMFQLVEAKKAEVIHGSMPSRKQLFDRNGEIKVRFLFQRKDESPYATDKELTRMGAEPKPTPKITPASAGLTG